MNILRNVPFFLPFEDRVNIHYKLLNDEKKKHFRVVKVGINRASLFEDGFQAFK